MAYAAPLTTGTALHYSFARRALDAITGFFVAYAEARSRHAEIARLSEMSDDELAARGLTREGIVRHVYADSLYL